MSQALALIVVGDRAVVLVARFFVGRVRARPDPARGEGIYAASNVAVPGLELVHQHPPRPRRSHWDHPVTGRSGSVQPEGHPIIQSVKAGLKIRARSECFSPLSKITRHRGEETGFWGVQPAAISKVHISVQELAAFFSPTWLPVWFMSV